MNPNLLKILAPYRFPMESRSRIGAYTLITPGHQQLPLCLYWRDPHRMGLKLWHVTCIRPLAPQNHMRSLYWVIVDHGCSLHSFLHLRDMEEQDALMISITTIVLTHIITQMMSCVLLSWLQFHHEVVGLPIYNTRYSWTCNVVVCFFFVFVSFSNSILFVVIKVDVSHMIILTTSPLLLDFEICDLNKIVSKSKFKAIATSFVIFRAHMNIFLNIKVKFLVLNKWS